MVITRRNIELYISRIITVIKLNVSWIDTPKYTAT